MADDDFTYQTAAQETWRIFRIMSEFVEGIDELSRVGPAVSVFGSARTPPDDPYYRMAVELGRKLAQRGFAVITGGGPGIMEAANRGASEVGGASIGLNIALPKEQIPNGFQTRSLDFHYFFVRKVMFLRYASAVVCLPGGFGTLDEFFESMTLIQTGKAQRMRLVLMGSEFWGPLTDWIRRTVLDRQAYISPEDLELFSLTDSVDEAVEICCQHRNSAPPAPQPAAAAIAAHAASQASIEGTVYGVRPRKTPPNP